MNVYTDLTEMIGHTPLLRLGRLFEEHQIFAKCEFMNPLSLKDRPVLQIIADAEQEGRLQPGSTLIEATSGNTGMAVAFIAAIKFLGTPIGKSSGKIFHEICAVPAVRLSPKLSLKVGWISITCTVKITRKNPSH